MKTLLIIDDEIDLAESLKDILEHTFENIVCLHDGTQALEYIRIRKPQLVISDFRMPKLNGIDLIQHLKTDGIDVPIILMTGVGDKDLVLKALRLGVIDVLEKPLHADVIKETVLKVKEILKRKNKVHELSNQRGDNDPSVIQEKKMLGLLENVNSIKKVSD